MDNLFLDYLVIALYFAVMIGAGYWGLRRARSADDYLVAGRRLGPFMYVGTLSDVIGALTVAYDLLTGALFVPIVGALFWRRATTAGALASMAAGSAVVVFFMVLDGLFANTPSIWGMLVSLVVFVVVSLITPGPSEEQARSWERRLQRPGAPP